MGGSNRPSSKGWNRAAKKKRGGPKAGVHGQEGLKEDNDCTSDVELALASSKKAQDIATSQQGKVEAVATNGGKSGSFQVANREVVQENTILGGNGHSQVAQADPNHWLPDQQNVEPNTKGSDREAALESLDEEDSEEDEDEDYQPIQRKCTIGRNAANKAPMVLAWVVLRARL